MLWQGNDLVPMGFLTRHASALRITLARSQLTVQRPCDIGALTDTDRVHKYTQYSLESVPTVWSLRTDITR